MANTLLTADMITREAIRLWKNSNSFLRYVDTQYDSQFAQSGAKIGTALRIRLPNDYVVRRGAAASIQDTVESNVTLTVATQVGVDIAFSSVERTMSLMDFSNRHLAPMMNNLVGDVALQIMTGIEGGACNFESKTSAGAIITPVAETWLLAGARLDSESCPRGTRKIILDPFTQARTVSSLSGLFNPSQGISEQYRSGEMMNALGADWSMDQTVLQHTTAAYSGTKTVNGASQTGTTLIVNAITGGLELGDIFTIAGVYAVNRITKQTLSHLRQFVVTADMASGGTSLSIYPAIIPPTVGGDPVQYQTVSASPANAATIVVLTATAEIYRKNFLLHPEAVTMVTADLELPGGVHESSRQVFDGISMRMVSDYMFGTDVMGTRLDVLFGYLWIRPEWVCIVADAV